MGEEHDAPQHHLNQADWIARMNPGAVVFEMLPPELGPVATARAGDDPGALGDALQWEDRGWPDFGIYAPVFAAAEGALILGAELSRDDLSRAVDSGRANSAGGDDPFGLSIPLPTDEQMAREAEQAEAHCNMLPAEALPGMVAAQRLRDAALAEATLKALEASGGPVAVITGNGHARTDRGVPALLRMARPGLHVISIGQSSGGWDEAPFDVLIRTDPPADRAGDPCDAFR
ncbi:hypothetical protein PAA8504_02934 [Palleronia abyssalis]|uniref:Haem-binding uptake Tiki superfamily ChaN domain-containing protein n=2 Tax=Palleronia abyssalis TaxID=1501240 RepID=A0A2R8BY88_9RHOB|nr:hypothetical protein PAA8504_02934 [Palleronia abyssalis]